MSEEIFSFADAERVQRLFQDLCRNSRTVYWRVDRSGLYTFITDVVQELLGYTPEELVGKVRYDELCPEEYRADLLDKANRIMAERRPFRNLENCARAKDGKLVWMSTNGIPLFDQKGEWLGYEGWDTDITERKQLEAQFLHAQRMESIGTMASGLAHNLNNALTPIPIAIAVIRQLSQDPAVLQSLQTIEASTERCLELSRQILSFARGVPSNPRPTDPVVILENAAAMVRASFPKNIQLVVHTGRDLPRIQADASQLDQVLLNLCVNARDAMPSGGILTLSVDSTVLDSARAASSPQFRPGAYVVFTVADTGTGIAADQLHHLFVPFYTTKPSGKGTGLGLSTSHNIVHAHRGFWNVQSTPGKGSVFQFFIPIMSSNGQPSCVESAPLPPPLTGKPVALNNDPVI